MKLIKTKKQRYTTLSAKEIVGSVYINTRRHGVVYLDSTGEFWTNFLKKYLENPTKKNSSGHHRWVVSSSTAEMVERLASIELNEAGI